MSESNIKRWNAAIIPEGDSREPWTYGSGGSWDMTQINPISDEMLAELAQFYHRQGTPWNCRSLPLSPSDREWMYLLYYSMQGLVARMRLAEKDAAQATTVRPIETAEEVHRAAQALVDRATELGCVLTIERRPLQPLAMSNQESVVEVRKARNG